MKMIANLFSTGLIAFSSGLIATDMENSGFDWKTVINRMPLLPIENTISSPQVLHFYPYGKSVWNHETTANYIRQHMQKARVLDSDADHMRHAIDLIRPEGLVLEFGVCTGRSINFIAALCPRTIVHGFDSFQGLPEDWKERGIVKGTFGFKDDSFRPPVLNNIRLHVGLFEEVLPLFVDTIHDQSIALIHLDADLYESTKTIFKYLGKHISPGTIIVFDEYFNYDGWENHEYKAFQEFIAESGLTYEYISYNSLHEQVAVRIVNHP
ncbi:MAG TPA: class I SAM-dependent methyltransferase [Chlamydiales bacterium]|nr:class I SAM-dependent methyltransferase [Chlamydiales bacterium]